MSRRSQLPPLTEPSVPAPAETLGHDLLSQLDWRGNPDLQRLESLQDSLPFRTHYLEGVIPNARARFSAPNGWDASVIRFASGELYDVDLSGSLRKRASGPHYEIAPVLNGHLLDSFIRGHLSVESAEAFLVDLSGASLEETLARKKMLAHHWGASLLILKRLSGPSPLTVGPSLMESFAQAFSSWKPFSSTRPASAGSIRDSALCARRLLELGDSSSPLLSMGLDQWPIERATDWLHLCFSSCSAERRASFESDLQQSSDTATLAQAWLADRERQSLSQELSRTSSPPPRRSRPRV